MMNNNDQNILAGVMRDQAQMLKKKIEVETNKSNSHDEKINQIKASIQAAKQRLEEKKEKLAVVQKKIVQEKQKGQQPFYSSSEQESSSNIQDQENDFSSSTTNNKIISQLREHFKALKMQMMTEFQGLDDEQDDYEDQVDVDNMTYEELLQLGERIGKVSKGLDSKKLQSLEAKKYHNTTKGETTECAICREELEEGTQCIELQCAHIFHQDCIKGWLNIEKNCPNCKREINFDYQGKIKE